MRKPAIGCSNSRRGLFTTAFSGIPAQAGRDTAISIGPSEAIEHSSETQMLWSIAPHGSADTGGVGLAAPAVHGGQCGTLSV